MDLAALLCMVFSLAYWWLSNLIHEVAGTVVFALVAWHLYQNRRWFGAVLRGRYDAARSLTTTVHLLFLLGFVVLCGSSILISETVLTLLPQSDETLLREVHWFSAYWVIFISGLHIGLNWRRITSWLPRFNTGPGRSSVRAMSAALGVLVVCFGIYSSAAIDLWTKLSFQYSIQFWDFSQSVAPFFFHWLMVVAMNAVVAGYLLGRLRARRAP